tara:strand:+ start:12148 stop:12771 length:624 start_codon:yes stop_codon:yes gene_type:complete
LIKKLIIFDLDGVLIDSKKNMELSWLKVQKKHNLEKIEFDEYFKHIGRPFYEILKKIGIKKNFSKIQKTYQIESINQITKISFYQKTISTLKKLKSRNFDLAIVTSKDHYRTKIFLHKYVNLFSSIEGGKKNLKGKPHPYKINKTIKLLNVSKSLCVYVGDTYIDYLTAKNSGIDFIFAKWGYGQDKNYSHVCKQISDLEQVIKKLK